MAGGAAVGLQKLRKRPRRCLSCVWQAFDRLTGQCTLPHPDDPTRRCGQVAAGGTGTTGHWKHLKECHPAEYANMRAMQAL